jgi:hypothetical protein
MHCQKLLILLLSSFLFSQTTINITEVASQLYKNQRINQHYLRFDSSINSKEKRRFFLNHRKNSASLSWFYLMGPYNDTWGSDILKVYNVEGKRPVEYFPFGNSILSFQSQYQNRHFDKSASVYLNVLGFNLKKIKTSNAKHSIYGSE